MREKRVYVVNTLKDYNLTEICCISRIYYIIDGSREILKLVVLYNGIIRCINGIPVINTAGLSIQKQSFTVQPNLLMYTLFKMFNSHLLLESWEYDDTVTKLQKLRVKLKPETPSKPLRYLCLWQVPVRAMMARLQEQSYLVSLPDIGCDRGFVLDHNSGWDVSWWAVRMR